MRYATGAAFRTQMYPVHVASTYSHHPRGYVAASLAVGSGRYTAARRERATKGSHRRPAAKEAQVRLMTPEKIPTLVCLIGPPAIGKTTIGRALCERTGYKLFDGHVVTDVLSRYFDFGTEAFVLLGRTWRQTFHEAAVKVGLNLVITVAWRFDVPKDKETVTSWLKPYLEKGRVICVELAAPLDVRIQRNQMDDRRLAKNPYWVSTDYLRETLERFRYDSQGAFPLDVPYLHLNTDGLAVADSAEHIIRHFNLEYRATFERHGSP
jgi:hypothetical protein